jgi:1,4-alpha-glucan branching enzyme
MARSTTPPLITGGALLVLVAGCAGGWRDGRPPGEPPVAATAPGATASAAGSVRLDATGVTADGVLFVYKGSGNSVAVAGEFNGWNTTADPMTRGDDGAWTLTRRLDPGRHPYKFVIDGNTWKEDAAATESTDDGHGGKNSVIVVPAGATATGAAGGAAVAGAAAAGAAAIATGATGKAAPPTPTDEGVVFTWAGTATSVAIAGDWNGWAINSDPLVKQADGTWRIVKKLAPGTYAYKFVVNGGTWKQDEANPESRDDGFGGKNSVVTVR